MAVLYRSNVAGIGYVIAAAAAYAAMDVTAKVAYEAGLPVATMLTLRFLGAGVVLLALGAAFRVKPQPTVRQALGLVALGSIVYAAESLQLNAALNAMAVGPAILIFHTYPAIVALIALALGRERINQFTLAALVLSSLGVSMLLAFPAGGMNRTGVLLAFGAAIAFAAYTLLAENALTHGHLVLVSGCVLLGAGMSVGVFGVGFGAVHLDIDGESWRWVAINIVLISIAVVAFTGSIALLGATRAAIGGTMQPAFTVALAAIILDERLNPLQIVGGAVLLAAIALLPVGAKAARHTIDTTSTE